jgi:hypothetical protein
MMRPLLKEAYGLVPADEPSPFKAEVPPSCTSIYQGGATRGPTTKTRASVALGTHVPTLLSLEAGHLASHAYLPLCMII